MIDFLQDNETTVAPSPEVLSLFNITKQHRDAFARNILSAINAGELQPLKVHLELKAVEDIINRLTDRRKYPETAIPYNDRLLENAAQYPGKSFEYINATFETMEAGIKYDFSKCNDSVLDELYKQQAAINKAVKAREAMLKAAPLSGLIITDETTGETYKVYPPSRTSTTTLAVSLR
jgi:hypothetical protein